MKRIAISAFAVCFAMAVPTALLADDHHDHSNQNTGSHGTPGGSSGQHGSTGGTTHDHHTTQTTGPSYHSYEFHNTTNTGGHMTFGHHPVVDISRFHRNFTAERHFHFRDYHGPAGWSYHRWGYGDNLPREYWAQDYWITNFLNFGLEAPPDGYVWVQYGNDALLIDEDTGEIAEVEYGIFY